MKNFSIIYVGVVVSLLSILDIQAQNWVLNGDKISNTNTGGNVGIGLSSPYADLHIKSASRADFRLEGSAANLAASGEIQFQAIEHDDKWYIRQFGDDNSNGVGGLGFVTNNNWKTPLFLDLDNKVGVGTTNPEELLHVNGAALIKHLDITKKRPAGSAADGINFGNSGQTNIHLTNTTWNGEHAILFNSYKNENQSSGGLGNGSEGNGNVLYANPEGLYKSGAGSIIFKGAGGEMDFFISPESTGKGQAVNWGVPKMRINREGNVGIGVENPDYKLTVDGKVRTREVKVTADGWADYVFEEDYELRDLEEVEAYVKEHKHLPNIPSEAEVLKDGVALGDMSNRLLEKVEELTLYLIEQDKRLKKLEAENKVLKNEVKDLKSK